MMILHLLMEVNVDIEDNRAGTKNDFFGGRKGKIVVKKKKK